MARPRTKYWYALKVFYNRVDVIRKEFTKEGCETYYPMTVEERLKDGQLQYVGKPLVPSLLFVCCTEKFLRSVKFRYESDFLYYSEPGTNEPGRIDDREMEIFIAATSIMDPENMYLGSDTARYCIGDKVRVTQGIYKGMEGYVRRVRHSRKVLVCIRGVAVVALSNIHPKYLEKIVS